MIRDLWDWLNEVAREIMPEGTIEWHVLTWIGHGVHAAAWVGMAALVSQIPRVPDLRMIAAIMAGGYYTIREIEQVILGRAWAKGVPWWDSLGDVASPWIVGLTLAAV